MKISIHRNETSSPIKYEKVINAYTKGSLYCVAFKKDSSPFVIVHKFPIDSIFRVEETEEKPNEN